MCMYMCIRTKNLDNVPTNYKFSCSKNTLHDIAKYSFVRGIVTNEHKTCFLNAYEVQLSMTNHCPI